jgi:hypothetical protein
MGTEPRATIECLPLREETRAVTDELRPLRITCVGAEDYGVLGGKTDGAGDGIETGRGGGRSELIERRRHGRRHELGKARNHARKAQDAQPTRRLTQSAHHRAVVERHCDRAQEDPDGQ